MLHTSGASMTYGNVICYRSGSYAADRLHEYAHVKEHDILRGYYLPLHAVTGAASWLSSGDTAAHNPLEWGPHSTPPRPWP
jgi:hypothetical protein